MFKVAFFASGTGTNIDAVRRQISQGNLVAKIEFVLSNNSTSGALQKAAAEGTATYHVSSVSLGGGAKVADKMLELLKYHQVDLLVLAGYMKKLPEEVIRYMPNRLINIHPALLPAFGGAGFYGDNIHKAVLKRGCQYTGVTVHMVDVEYDEGPIILQRTVQVPLGIDLESLRKSVMSVEYDSLWRVIAGYSRGILKPSAEKLEGIPDFQSWCHKELQSVE